MGVGKYEKFEPESNSQRKVFQKDMSMTKSGLLARAMEAPLTSLYNQ